MKIEMLHEYIVLAHYMNFTHAAANLHTSQPNLSKHLSEMEQEIGVELIKRGKKLELTPAGAAFLEDGVQITKLYKDALSRAREIAAHETVELFVQEPYVMDDASEILLKSVMQFKRENPYAVVKYFNESSKKSIELLEQKKIDVALAVDCGNERWIKKASETKNLIFYPLIKERLFVWMHESNPLVNKSKILLDDLLSYQVNVIASRRFDPMRYALMDLFQNNLNEPPDLKAHSNDSLTEFFTNTQDYNALFIVSESMARSQMLSMHEDMVASLIDDDRAYISTYLVFREDYQKSALDDFLDVIEKTVGSGIDKNPHAYYLDEIAQSLQYNKRIGFLCFLRIGGSHDRFS